MNHRFEATAIARIVASLARAGIRRSIFQEEPAPLAALPKAAKAALVRDVARFFGLEETAAFPAFADDYSLWAQRVYEAVRAKDVMTFTFVTSGSTGQPCPHTFTLDELVEEATALQPFFADRTRVVSVMPVHHVYGFAFALMLPRLLGIPVREMPPLPSAAFFRELREGDMALGVPVFWKAWLEACSGQFALSCPANIHGVTSGAPCPPETIEGLLAVAERTGRPLLDGMTEIYGATEFGAVGIRRQCRDSYTLLPHWRRLRVPSKGTDTLSPLRGFEEEGGENVWGIGRENGPVLSPPDDILWQGEQNFIPIGRKDRAVQVGGRNVFPARVAGILRCHPKVRDCAVRMMRPEEGSRLKAFIVPSYEAISGETLSERSLIRELRQWLAAQLDSASMPKSFSFGPVMPASALGKLADWDIAGCGASDFLE